jgi:rhomboid protease GluP
MQELNAYQLYGAVYKVLKKLEIPFNPLNNDRLIEIQFKGKTIAITPAIEKQVYFIELLTPNDELAEQIPSMNIALEEVLATNSNSSLETSFHEVLKAHGLALTKQGEVVPIEQTKIVNKIKNSLSYKSPIFLTSLIIALNFLWFIIVAVFSNGNTVLNPEPQLALNYGANFLPSLLDDAEWWRLFTAMFFHYGILHLLMNMYSLYAIGPIVETTLNRKHYFFVYVVAGVFGNVVSVWWHGLGPVGAGASGAIFGVFGVLLSFTVSKLFAAEVRKDLLKNIGIVLLINIFIGFSNKTIDNSAHFGGLIVGFIYGLIWSRGYRSNKKLIKDYLPKIVIGSFVIGISFFVFFSLNGGYKKIKAAQNELIQLENNMKAEANQNPNFVDNFKILYFPEFDKKAIRFKNLSNELGFSYKNYLLQIIKRIEYFKWSSYYGLKFSINPENQVYRDSLKYYQDLLN